MVPEMQEIDEFFDSLNPNIEVIWGISTDSTIGEDAKVTILATGMEEREAVAEEMKDDAYYESLIPQLYRPIEKPAPEPEKEPDFVVESAPVPEPSVSEPDPPKRQPTLGEKLGKWLKSIVQETDE